MRPSIALTALCAATAIAADVQKRSYKTEVVVVTVTETVYPGGPTVAPEPEPVNKHNGGQNNGGQKPPHQHPQHPHHPPPNQPNDTPVIGDDPGNPNNPPQNPPQPQYPTKQPQPTEQPEPTKEPEPTEPAPQPTTEPEPEPTQPTQPPIDNTYQGQVLHHHNIHRRNHSAPAIEWDESLVDSARKLAKSCDYGHNTDYNGGGYGQNIGYGVGAQDVGMMITNMMYNEEFGYFEPQFGVASPVMDDFKKWGHLTQILWKSTTHVGCITVPCTSLKNVDDSPSEPIPYTVCNYSPAGNYADEYAENVGQPLGKDQVIAE